MKTSANRILVLASASLRRQALLKQIGLDFEVDRVEWHEKLDIDLKPYFLAETLSLEKARAVVPRHPNAVILAADTIGSMGSKVFGKPATAEEARSLLKMLSGRAHRVITGFTIIDSASGRMLTHSVETTVKFRRLTESEIDNYIRSGEPLGKAGGYAIQGLGALLIEKIDGDYYNVVGLPLATVADNLKEFGIHCL